MLSPVELLACRQRYVASAGDVEVPTLAPSAHHAIHSHASAAQALLLMSGGTRARTSEGRSYELEWIADSGAGRSLASHEGAQGIFVDDRLCRDDETIVFETGKWENN